MPRSLRDLFHGTLVLRSFLVEEGDKGEGQGSCAMLPTMTQTCLPDNDSPVVMIYEETVNVAAISTWRVNVWSMDKY